MSIFLTHQIQHVDYTKQDEEEMKSATHVHTLPDELILKIFSWLPVTDLCSVSLVSRSWQLLAEDPSLWRHFLLQINYGTKQLSEVLRFRRFARLNNLLIRGFDPYNEDQMRFDPEVVVRSNIRNLELRLAYIDRNVRDFSLIVNSLSSLTLMFCLMTQVIQRSHLLIQSSLIVSSCVRISWT